MSAHLDPPAASRFPENVVTQAPEDPLFGLMAAFRRDPSDKKVDLGIGAYRDDNAKPWVLPVVKKAEDLIRQDPNWNHEYLPIAGLPEFRTATAKLMFGEDSPALKDERVVTMQTISGTGAVHLGALFLAKFYARPHNEPVYFSSPTWANHNQIFGNVGLPVQTYPYFAPQTRGLDADGMLRALDEAPRGSIVLLHACAHNPTGVDPTPEQWRAIARVVRRRAHFPFFDCAYQGFASGDLARDAWPVRYFVSEGFELCVAQSFAKNFGLYGERAGAFHFVAAPSSSSSPSSSSGDGSSGNKNNDEARAIAGRIASQLAILQRSEISNPPAYGAKIAARVLNDAALFAEWEDNLRTMSGRIRDMRRALRERLEALGTPGSWRHITDQIGMFSFTGLTEEQVARLRSESSIYMTRNGRISMAGLNTHNVEHVATAIDRVVRATSSS